MTRLNILVEGKTELRFVKDVLAPHLADPFNIIASPQIIETSRDKARGKRYKGGGRSYDKLHLELCQWMKHDQDIHCYFTSMFDLYAFPSDFPYLDESQKINDIYKRIHFIEQKFQEDINKDFSRIRFIPYIQLHEFEALIFADPKKLEIEYIGFEAEIQSLVEVAAEKGNPELINDGPETAPSKRIINAIPRFEKNKPSGAMVAKEIGLPVLRARCAHFGKWLTMLESLADGV